MAYYIKENRILTEEEKFHEDATNGLTELCLALIGIVFLLSPGIVITSLIHWAFQLTTGQLWGSAVICTIAVVIIMYFTIGISLTRYLICASTCAGFIIILTLCFGDNIFWNTVKDMFETEENEKTKTTDYEQTSMDEQKTYYFRAFNS